MLKFTGFKQISHVEFSVRLPALMPPGLMTCINFFLLKAFFSLSTGPGHLMIPKILFLVEEIRPRTS